MAVSIEKSGKTVQHAINDALDELNVSADDVVIEVLEEGESGGILGIGRKPAKVRVTIEENEIAGDNQDFVTQGTTDSVSTDETYYGDDEENFDEANENQTDSDAAEGDSETPEEAETTAYIASILSGIGIHGRISSFREENTIHVDVSGEDCGAAIGRRGETLDAIQYLATLVANRVSEDRMRVILDIDGYRRRREDSLISMADRMAEKVVQSGRPYRLQPMSPAERRIVHSSLQNFEGVTTFSEGEDPQRHVVIMPEENDE